MEHEILVQKQKMAEIIERSISDNNTKEVFKKLFSNIYDYNSEHIEHILENVRQGFNTSLETTDIEIKNILADRQTAVELKEYDYVINPSHLKTGVFINLPYEELMRNYADKTFRITLITSDESYTVNGKLRRSSVFVKREKILRNLAEQYKIKFPMIYMPYARKYFELIINNFPVDKELITDITIDGIDSDILKPNCRYFLMWNISIKDRIDSIQFLENENPGNIIETDKVTPYFDRLVYSREYINIQPNQYILFDFIGAGKYSISRRDDRICVCCENVPPKLDGRIITVLSGNTDNPSEIFTNYYKKHYIVSGRLRSYADIEYALSCFRDNPWNIRIGDDFKIEYQNNMKHLEVIMNYDKDYTYYPEEENTDSDNTINLRSSVNCIITFSGGTYTDDFANYVLDFLRRNYPEFNWQGVIK